MWSLKFKWKMCWSLMSWIWQKIFSLLLLCSLHDLSFLLACCYPPLWKCCSKMRCLSIEKNCLIKKTCENLARLQFRSLFPSNVPLLHDLIHSYSQKETLKYPWNRIHNSNFYWNCCCQYFFALSKSLT
jgi:hypothetical protein